MTEKLHNQIEEKQQVADSSARSALISANGIVLGFFITFGATWVNAPGPWEARDAWFGVPYLIGIALLIFALKSSLLPYQLTVHQYTKSAWSFLGGLTFALLAIVLSTLT